MRFVETQKGIWIPEGTKLEDHAPKTINYALLHDLDVEGVVTLDTLVSIPPMDATRPLLYRADYIEEILTSLSSASQIPFTADDYLVRSALTFEDTVATRAAGIGDSARFQKAMTPEKKRGMLEMILGYEFNPDILAYTKKHGISDFSLGLQICPTIVYEDDDVADSGSAKLLADDFVEITVNQGHSFEGMQNKVPAFRYYFQKEEGKWKKKFERKDDSGTYLDRDSFMEFLAKPLLATLDALKKRRDFPEGLEVEYIKETQVSAITLVQYAPISYLPHSQFQNVSFSHKNDPSLPNQVILGVGEKYFPHNMIAFLCHEFHTSDQKRTIQKLQSYNADHPGGYLFVDLRYVGADPIDEIPYQNICNATAFLHLANHIGHLSDHMSNISREQGTLIGFPSWRGNLPYINEVEGFNDKYRNLLQKGLSLRVNERTQECFVAYGNVWER